MSLAYITPTDKKRRVVASQKAPDPPGNSRDQAVMWNEGARELGAPDWE